MGRGRETEGRPRLVASENRHNDSIDISILSLPICIIFSSPPRQKARRCGTEKGPDHFLSVHSFLSPTFCLASHPIHNRFSSCCKEQKVHGREKGALLRGWGRRGDGASSTHLSHAATASVWQPNVTGKQSDLPFSFSYPADPFTFLSLPPRPQSRAS